MTGRTNMRTGVFCATAAFLTWGLAPVYWKQLVAVPAVELLGHRILWAFVVVAAWMSFRGRLRRARAAMTDRSTLLALLASTGLIALNWGLFIWAVNSGHILDASLGYYINPLVNVALGLAVLRERLNRLKAVSVALAVVGVVVLTVSLGSFPWISVVLALSFGFYGLVRKMVRADAATGLLFETGLLAPLALAYLVSSELRGIGALGHRGPTVDLLLLFAGVITAVPLALFTAGARRLPLSTVGLLQYLAPTGHLLLAVFAYGERFTAAHAASFACIWAALCIFTWDLRARLREARELAGLAGGEVATTLGRSD